MATHQSQHNPRPALSRPWALILLLLLASAPACSASTRIETRPSGAEVLLDGERVGKTPLTHKEESVWVWTEHSLIVSKEGYMPISTKLEAELKPGFVVLGALGCLCLVGGILMFVGDYEERYAFTLQAPSTGDEDGDGGVWVYRRSVDFEEQPGLRAQSMY